MVRSTYRFDSINDPAFEMVPRSDPNIYWHNGTFDGYEKGIIDFGGPPDLVTAKKWQEVDVVHSRLVQPDPPTFFAVPGSVWYYTGTVGHAPDFVGFSRSNRFLVGELKWADGWHPRLLGQFNQYSNDLISGNRKQYELEFYIAAPQTCGIALINDILAEANALKSWSRVNTYFGFMQLGWLPTHVSPFYLRVLWFEASEWNGERFAYDGNDGPDCN